jgi:hypothetical protein
MGLYKKNNSSHNSPSERITFAQESVAIFSFLDMDDTFLTRVEVPIHFSGDLFRSFLSLRSLFLFYVLRRVLTSRSHHYKPLCPFAHWDMIGGCDLSAEASLNAPL